MTGVQKCALPISLIIAFCAADGVEQFGIFTTEGGVEEALVGVDEVLSADGTAVAPAGFLPQVKGPDAGILIMLPAGSHGRVDAGRVGGIGAHEPFEKAGNDFAVRDGGCRVGIEALGLRIIANEENALTRGALSRRLTWPAARQSQQDQDAQ